MKNECNIIKDLLPLYNENLISQDTRTFVDKHLEICTDCGETLKKMQTPTNISLNLSAVPLKNIKVRLQKKRITTIVFTAALVLAILIALFSFLTAPQYLPFSEELISISESENGKIIITFNDDVTGYDLDIQQNTETSVYYISAWKTTWDQHFSKGGAQNVILEPVFDKPFSVYYDLNDATESIFIYGEDPYPNMGTTPLPRLVLSYYITLAALAAVALAVLLLLFRKKQTVKIWIERLIIFPIAYILGHLCIKGFSMETYSSGRDFSIILLIAILFYLAGLLGISLYRAKKESNKNDKYM